MTLKITGETAKAIMKYRNVCATIKKMQKERKEYSDKVGALNECLVELHSQKDRLKVDVAEYVKDRENDFRTIDPHSGGDESDE